VADPPPDDDGDVWSETGKGRSQSNNYPTMTLAEIKTKYPLLPLAPNALVYIWTTSGFLDQAIASLKFWGCAYGDCLIWDKVHPTKGRWHIMQAEYVIYGNKGKKGLPIPLRKDKTRNLFRDPRSTKRG